ncbi:LPE10 [Candida pseudojiufengensis]|uniref:LPE10 n=1 Tax=Candida pseudojiufengensis TaxID=497109 RepID=UPI00222452E3|nr:LPE10 [Candida pseudojiufengensis]KAI5963076.1 LPE10 [Candida pseudojiufengensis]
MLPRNIQPLPRILRCFKDLNNNLSILRHPTRSTRFVSTKPQHFKKQKDSFDDLFISKTLSSTKYQDDELIKCTIFDENGVMIHHGKEIAKSQFMKQYNLIPRDFRKISKHTTVSGSKNPSLMMHNIELVPSLVTRKNCIMLNLSNVRALINKDKVTLFDSHSFTRSESHTQSQFLKQLSDNLKKRDENHVHDEYYEFKALETILIHVIANLTTEMKVHKTIVTNVLSGLDESIERFKLRYLLIQSKKLAQFQQKVTLIRDLLEDVLERDDELNDLYLTDPRTGTNHEEIEMLLESYYKTADEIVQTVDNLRSQIKTTEEIINIVLDSNRNELMLLGLKFSTGLLSMGVALYFAALYGMNLENFIEESDGGFEFIILVSMLSLAGLLFVSVKQLKKVEKITMTNFKGGRNR